MAGAFDQRPSQQLLYIAIFVGASGGFGVNQTGHGAGPLQGSAYGSAEAVRPVFGFNLSSLRIGLRL